MRTIRHGAVLVTTIWILALLAACAPAAPEAAVTTPPSSTVPGTESPAVDTPFPDVTPDPVALQTTAPGQHLDAIGTVTALGDGSIDVDGVTYLLTPATEVQGTLTTGDKVKLEYAVGPDGSRTVLEAKGPGFFDN
jgi:hypothetical protein